MLNGGSGTCRQPGWVSSLLCRVSKGTVVALLKILTFGNDDKHQPGGHLFLSTVSRTPLAYLLTIFAAEKLLRLVEPGTHTYEKYVKPSELIDFFRKPLRPGERPWISNVYNGTPPRSEAEVRGIAYLPWKGTWELAPRGAVGSTECNYLFWARKPRLG